MKLLILLALALLVPSTLAYGWMHDQFETYDDLVEYREETGHYAMPWVQDEEDFALAKERFEYRENYRWHHCW